MFGLFKSKSEVDKLKERHAKLLEESFALFQVRPHRRRRQDRRGRPESSSASSNSRPPGSSHLPPIGSPPIPPPTLNPQPQTLARDPSASSPATPTRPDKRAIAKVFEEHAMLDRGDATEQTGFLLEGSEVELEISDANVSSAYRAFRKHDIDYEIVEG